VLLAVKLDALELPVVPFFAISSKGGLHTTTSTLFAKHSPSSCQVCPSFALHCAVQTFGLPKAVMFLLLQQSYRSQKAWSLTSRALEMTHAPSSPRGRSMGNCEGWGVGWELAEQEYPGPQENMLGMMVGFEKVVAGSEAE
jgi:hypothetical protein